MGQGVKISRSEILQAFYLAISSDCAVDGSEDIALRYIPKIAANLARRLVHCPSDRRANKHRQSRSTVRLLILRFVATVSPPKKQLRELVKTRYIVASMGCERLCNRKELSGKPTNKTFNQGVVGSSPTALTKSKTMDRKY